MKSENSGVEVPVGASNPPEQAGPDPDLPAAAGPSLPCLLEAVSASEPPAGPLAPGRTTGPPAEVCRDATSPPQEPTDVPLPIPSLTSRLVFPRTRTTGVVLLVEDDPVTRLTFQRVLEKHGYSVRTAGSGDEAFERLRLAEEIDAAILDYALPDTTGIEILDSIRLRESRLAASLVTAMGEKEIIAEAMREGACGFLEKPVGARELTREVKKLVSTTRRNRRLANMVEEVQQLSRLISAYQREHLEQPLSSWPLEVRTVHHPLYEVGGDHLLQHRLNEQEWLLISVDISGHDLSAACTLAYFQGIATGILSQGGTPEQLVRGFHDALVEQQASLGEKGAPVSAALCCLLFRPGRVEVACYGSPQPVLTLPGRLSKTLGACREPLGWFEQLEWNPESYELPPGSTVSLWTDGLEDLASYLGIDTLALAYTLLLPGGASGLEDAADDVMMVTVSHKADGAATPARQACILRQRYGGEQIAEIDALQQFWQRSLLWALPAVSSDRLHDILLCCREAVINSLQHGCGEQDHVHLEALYDESRARLTIQVKDCGTGHNSDWRQALEDDGSGMREFSRGLLLIHSLPAAVFARDNGAHLIMEFELR